MNILIAGGTGMIGRALTKELISHGHSVNILTRSPKKASDLAGYANILRWDGETTHGWGEVISKIDAVVNLAGTPLNGDGLLDIWLTEKRKGLLLSSRINAAKALIQAISEAEKKPEVFVQASAVGYYGFSGDEIIDEAGAPGEDFLASVQIQNEEVTEVLETMGVRRILIRTGIVLDRAEGSLQYFLLQFSLFAGGRIGSGEQYYAWIHLRDAAAAIRMLVENQLAKGPFNLTSPNPEKNKEFAKVLGKVMRRPSFFVIPAFLMRLVLGEISAVILNGSRVVPKKLLQLGFKFQFPDLEKALEDIL